MDWFGQMVCLERLYESHRKSIEALSCFYQQNCINMMLLKEYGQSRYWPKPEHRPMGDMDIYLGSCWQEADRLINEKLGIRIDEYASTFPHGQLKTIE